MRLKKMRFRSLIRPRPRPKTQLCLAHRGMTGACACLIFRPSSKPPRGSQLCPRLPVVGRAALYCSEHAHCRGGCSLCRALERAQARVEIRRRRAVGRHEPLEGDARGGDRRRAAALRGRAARGAGARDRARRRQPRVEGAPRAARAPRRARARARAAADVHVARDVEDEHGVRFEKHGEFLRSWAGTNACRRARVLGLGAAHDGGAAARGRVAAAERATRARWEAAFEEARGPRAGRGRSSRPPTRPTRSAGATARSRCCAPSCACSRRTRSRARPTRPRTRARARSRRRDKDRAKATHRLEAAVASERRYRNARRYGVKGENAPPMAPLGRPRPRASTRRRSRRAAGARPRSRPRPRPRSR